MNHLVCIIIIALVARGVSFILMDGQVFGAVGRMLKKLPSWAHKPLGTCGNCAVWLWGTAALVVLGLLPDPLWYLTVYWIAATGLQDLIDP